MPQHDSRAIANWFIERGQLEAGRTFTPMQLQKLVYIASGWNLALNDGQELVREPVEAWDYGPVYPRLYGDLARWGSSTVREPVKTFSPGFVMKPISATVTEDEAKVLEAVYTGYGSLSGLQLSNMTHQPGTPWSQTYQPGVRGKKIPSELIRQHFLELSRR